MKLIGKGVHDCQRLSSPCTVSVMVKHNHVTMVLDVSEDVGYLKVAILRGKVTINHHKP